MSNDLKLIREWLQSHYDEAAAGLVEKYPSQLLRGEGTEKKFFIMKIDLVGSTQLLLRKRGSTYLKLAHTYLSTIDKITQKFGADPDQVEYAGDSVLAYFSERGTSAEDVLTAACYSRVAVEQIQHLDGPLKGLGLMCKIVLHFDSLIMSKIGPRTNSTLTAIGWPLHLVAKLEKDISPGIGWATEKFFNQADARNRRFFSPNYVEEQIPVTVPTLSTLPLGYLPLFGTGVSTPQRTLADLLYPQPNKLPPAAPQYTTKRTLTGYQIRWPLLFRELGLV